MTIADQPGSEEKLSILRRIALFSSCTEEHLHLVAARTRLVEYKKGEMLYREGEAAAAEVMEDAAQAPPAEHCLKCFSRNVAHESGCSGVTCHDCGHSECS